MCCSSKTTLSTLINNDLRTEIRTASIWNLMLKLSPVAILAMSINSINTFVDALFIGQFLGEEALAGVSLAFAITFFTNAFAAMIGVGGSSLLSIAIGAKDHVTQEKVFGTVVLLSIIAAILLTITGFSLAEWMISGIGGEGQILDLGVEYYQMLILGAVFQIVGVTLNFIIRAEGKIKEAMFMTIVSVIANMILNPVLIGYFQLGVAGAAYASIISMVILTAMGLWYFINKRTSYAVRLNFFKLERALYRPILGIGVSAMMLQLMFIVQQVITFKMLDQYGDERDIAFMGVCYRVLLLMLIPGIGFSSAMQPVTGINFGANDYPRVKEAFWKFTLGCVLLTLSLMLLFVGFPKTILAWMLPNTTFTAMDIYHFRLFIAPGFLSSMLIMCVILYQSIGNAKVAGIMMVLRELIFFIPPILILPLYYGKTGIYATPLIQNSLTLILVVIILWRLFQKWDNIAELAS